MHFLKSKLVILVGLYIPSNIFSLFREKISACAAAHMRYAMDACDHVPPIIPLPPMIGTSFAKH